MASEVDAIISTELLETRAERERDFKAESEILQTLALGLADSDQDVLNRLVAAAVRICDAGSAGLSLHDVAANGDPVLTWKAVDGAYSKYLGGTLPLFSPCGVCLDRGRAELFCRPERVFTYLSDVRPEIVEALVIPLRAGGAMLGTIWIASHTEGSAFTASDLAIMTTLANFTAASLTLIARERAARDSASRERAERERAEAVYRRKDDFLSTISHELRTPLHAILSWSELLVEGLPEADARDAALSIHRNAERQAILVDDLLDSSRFLAGASPMQAKPVAIGELVASVIESVRPAIDAKALTIRSSCRSPLSRVMGDGPRLHQAVANIVGNAVKFTPRGGAVHAEVQADQSHVRVRVTDTGVGMSAEFIERAFDRFSQADSSYARRAGGLGLGLAIADEIVSAHGGSIEAQSEGPDRGATFTVILPLAPAHATGPERSQSPKTVSLAGRRVLVVDDEPDARDALGTVLRHRDAIVEIASSAEEALTMLAVRPADVLLTDLAMPHQDGYQLLERLRRHPNPRVRGIPAIAVTAYSTQPDRDRTHQAGFHAVVVKPVPARELVHAVATVLKIDVQ